MTRMPERIRAAYNADELWERRPRFVDLDWLMGDAPVWFRELYLRHGERFALWLAPHASLKFVIRLWMDSRIERKQSAARLLPLSAH